VPQGGCRFDVGNGKTLRAAGVEKGCSSLRDSAAAFRHWDRRMRLLTVDLCRRMNPRLRSEYVRQVVAGLRFFLSIGFAINLSVPVEQVLHVGSVSCQTVLP